MEKKLNGKSENADNTVSKQRTIGIPFTKDDPRINREGRPLGSRNFSTDFDEVVEEIAKANNITASEARKILLRAAYSEAKNKNFPYYKDIMDRYYGKAQDNLDVTSGGKPIGQLLDELTDTKTEGAPEK